MNTGIKVRSNKNKKRGSYKKNFSQGANRKVKSRNNKGKNKRLSSFNINMSGGSGSGSSFKSNLFTLKPLSKDELVKFKPHTFSGSGGTGGGSGPSFKYKPVIQNWKEESLGITFSKKLSSDEKPIVKKIRKDSVAEQWGIKKNDKLLGIFQGDINFETLHCDSCGNPDGCGSPTGGPVKCKDTSFGSNGCLIGPPDGDLNLRVMMDLAKKAGTLNKDQLCWAFQPSDCEGDVCSGP